MDTKIFFPEEHLFFMSGRNNNQLREEYRKKHHNETKDLADSMTVTGVFHFRPIVEDGKTIGTSIFLISCTDMGNAVPGWALRKFAPKGLDEFFDDFVAQAQKHI